MWMEWKTFLGFKSYSVTLWCGCSNLTKVDDAIKPSEFFTFSRAKIMFNNLLLVTFWYTKNSKLISVSEIIWTLWGAFRPVNFGTFNDVFRKLLRSVQMFVSFPNVLRFVCTCPKFKCSFMFVKFRCANFQIYLSIPNNEFGERGSGLYPTPFSVCDKS